MPRWHVRWTAIHLEYAAFLHPAIHNIRSYLEDCPGASLFLESVTISWLPADGAVQLRRLLPEPGRNWGLDETIREVQSEDERASYWGPYEIEKQLYCRALAQRAHLESGEVKYKAVDTAFPSERVSNCIHAVGDISGEDARVRVISPSWGDTASYFVLLQLRPWIIRPEYTHDWLLQALCLDKYCLNRRDMNDKNPAGGRVLRTLQNVRHMRLSHSTGH